MTRPVILGAALILTALVLLTSCDKERIVNSKEYITETKYVTLPPDTVWRSDTVRIADSVLVHEIDTVVITNTIRDTIRITTVIHDTVTTVVNHWDTVVVIDTVVRTQCLPNALLAISAMQYHTDPLVYEFIQAEIGLTGGWVYYLSSFQMEITPQSTNIYDIYAYCDYWSEDFSGYYPLEIYWRLTFTGGDPGNPANWQMTDPPMATPARRAGIRLAPKAESVRPLD